MSVVGPASRKTPSVRGLLLLGGFGGMLSGFFGVGGGVVFVPVLATVFVLRQQEAQGTSLTIIIPTALLGLITYSLHQPLRWNIALPMMIGAVIFAYMSASLAARVPATLLKTLFFILILLTAVRLFFS
ncbi:MAG: sulfite exporter TauE/SafE family protein [Chloroflexi bacterium]|nr:sulfite exporter TauE/SafE family protein [Chloroflexota bacterium]